MNKQSFNKWFIITGLFVNPMVIIGGLLTMQAHRQRDRNSKLLSKEKADMVMYYKKVSGLKIQK